MDGFANSSAASVMVTPPAAEISRISSARPGRCAL